VRGDRGVGGRREGGGRIHTNVGGREELITGDRKWRSVPTGYEICMLSVVSARDVGRLGGLLLTAFIIIR
jgi:hypothetical protein